MSLFPRFSISLRTSLVFARRFRREANVNNDWLRLILLSSNGKRTSTSSSLVDSDLNLGLIVLHLLNRLLSPFRTFFVWYHCLLSLNNPHGLWNKLSILVFPSLFNDSIVSCYQHSTNQMCIRPYSISSNHSLRMRIANLRCLIILLRHDLFKLLLYLIILCLSILLLFFIVVRWWPIPIAVTSLLIKWLRLRLDS